MSAKALATGRLAQVASSVRPVDVLVALDVRLVDGLVDELGPIDHAGPHGLGLSRVVGREERLHLGDAFRMCLRDVVPFGGVVGQVEEPDLVRAIGADQLPILMQYGLLVALPSEQRFVRNARGLSADVWQKVHAVNDPVPGQPGAGSGGEGREEIEVMHRVVHHRPGGDARRPAGGERHVQPALEVRQLPAAVRLVHVGKPDVVGAAVVAREHDEGVLRQPIRFERLLDAPHAPVHGQDHAGVDT